MVALRLIGITAFRALAVICLTSSFCQAQDLGEEWPDKLEDARIIVLKPRVNIYERTFGNILDHREDWSAAGRQQVFGALQALLAESKAAITWQADVPLPAERQTIADGLMAIHSAVGAAMMAHFDGRNGLIPSKRADLLWTLGEGTRDLQRFYEADYALFLEFNDSHDSVGRLAGKLFPPDILPEFKNRQVSLASLVHLDSGRVVWFRHRMSRFGDLREAKGAEAAVIQVLAGFPTL